MKFYLSATAARQKVFSTIAAANFAHIFPETRIRGITFAVRPAADA
jgi:hypothetical protein